MCVVSISSTCLCWMNVIDANHRLCNFLNIAVILFNFPSAKGSCKSQSCLCKNSAFHLTNTRMPARWTVMPVGSLELLSAFHGYAAIRKSGLNACKGSNEVSQCQIQLRLFIWSCQIKSGFLRFMTTAEVAHHMSLKFLPLYPHQPPYPKSLLIGRWP